MAERYHETFLLKPVLFRVNSLVILSFSKKNITIFGATLQNAHFYHLQNYTSASALVVGTEATGLSEAWRDNNFQNINILGKLVDINITKAYQRSLVGKILNSEELQSA